MSDTRKIIDIEDNYPNGMQNSLESQNRSYRGFFLGAYQTGYFYWIDETTFMNAILKNNPTPVRSDGSLNINLDEIDPKEAYYCSSREELEQAIKDGKVYCYIEARNNLYLPEAEL
ncbi:MAG: hypothetical protein NC090_05745 [Anaeroplasma bactoclasticum]|nr:hypothetical protein [Anaeroplasma bactoclasticum]